MQLSTINSSKNFWASAKKKRKTLNFSHIISLTRLRVSSAVKCTTKVKYTMMKLLNLTASGFTMSQIYKATTSKNTEEEPYSIFNTGQGVVFSLFATSHLRWFDSDWQSLIINMNITRLCYLYCNKKVLLLVVSWLAMSDPRKVIILIVVMERLPNEVDWNYVATIPVRVQTNNFIVFWLISRLWFHLLSCCYPLFHSWRIWIDQ